MNINTPNFQAYQGPNSGPQVTQTDSAGDAARVNKTTRVNDTQQANNANKRPEQVNDQDAQSSQQGLSSEQYQSVVEAHQEHQTTYDQPQGNQRAAISSYQSVLNAPKREEIQRLVGIDTFA